jgi:hypothetical protein
MSAPDVTVADAVDTYLAPLHLDYLGSARASIARALARKLVAAVACDESRPLGLATPSIAKELRDVLDAIADAIDDVDRFTLDLFAEVGDPPKP